MAKNQVSTTDETRHQISKPEQPKGPPYIALQYCKVPGRRTHSCRSKTLKHAALLKHDSRCKQRNVLSDQRDVVSFVVESSQSQEGSS